MAKVIMRVGVSGTRSGQDWPAPGEVLVCDEDEARQLCANGMAIPAPVEEPETTAAPTRLVEKRAVRKQENG